MKALAIVRTPRIDALDRRAKKAMECSGWQIGIIRARLQFHDDDRRAALRAAGEGQEHAALALHHQADQHLAALENACKVLAGA